MQFTAIYITAPDGSIAAHVEEFPAVVAQAARSRKRA
jgi:predicted RNase H-like HicB family nuclease